MCPCGLVICHSFRTKRGSTAVTDPYVKVVFRVVMSYARLSWFLVLFVTDISCFQNILQFGPVVHPPDDHLGRTR